MKSSRPLQRLSYSKKIANKNEWGKENVDYHIGISNFTYSGSSGERDVQGLYDIYNNKLPDSWFYFVKNPLNSTKNEFKNFPARIREYTILRPNIDFFHGTFSQRPFNIFVINAAHEALNTFMEKRKEVYKQNLTQHFINYANSLGANTGEESKQVPLPEQVAQQFASSYKDEKAVKGQKAIKIIREENALDELHKDLFKDWLIAGEAYTYKGVRLSDIDYERVSPLECDYDKSGNTKYTEDGEWFTRRFTATISDVIDKFYEELKGEDLEKLEDRGGIGNRGGQGIRGSFNSFNHNREDFRDKIEVIHVTWKSEAKAGILSYPDPLTGEMQMMEVDEDYPVNKEIGESVEWFWYTQVWEGYRVDGDIYLGIKPLPVQRNKMNRFSYCKLPYNGVRFSDTHTSNISPLELGIPFQIMHIILKYRLELTIAKNKGKIVLIDQNVIPKKAGWDEEKFFYYSEATGWGFIDRNQIGVDKSYNQYQVLDLTLFEHIEQVLALIASNKAEWDEVLGINPHVKGQTKASDAVSNVQQNIVQSTVISDSIFNKFEDFLKTEYRGLLDISKFAWIDGKKKMYRSDDGRMEMLDIDGEDYLDSELDIFVTNSSKEVEKLNMLKANAQAFAQNQGKPSMIAEIIAAENFAEVAQKLKRLEEMEQELAERMEDNKVKGEIEKLRVAQEFEEIKHAFDLEVQADKYLREMEQMEREYDRKEQIEYIKGDVAIHTFQGTPDTDGNGIADINEIEKRAVEREKIMHDSINKDRELSLKNKEISVKKEAIESKERMDKYKADVSLKIAKQNKNKHDSKK